MVYRGLYLKTRRAVLFRHLAVKPPHVPPRACPVGCLGGDMEIDCETSRGTARRGSTKNLGFFFVRGMFFREAGRKRGPSGSGVRDSKRSRHERADIESLSQLSLPQLSDDHLKIILDHVKRSMSDPREVILFLQRFIVVGKRYQRVVESWVIGLEFGIIRVPDLKSTVASRDVCSDSVRKFFGCPTGVTFFSETNNENW